MVPLPLPELRRLSEDVLFPQLFVMLKNYPWDINYMPVAIYFVFLDLRKNDYSRTTSYLGHYLNKGSMNLS